MDGIVCCFVILWHGSAGSKRKKRDREQSVTQNGAMLQEMVINWTTARQFEMDDSKLRNQSKQTCDELILILDSTLLDCHFLQQNPLVFHHPLLSCSSNSN